MVAATEFQRNLRLRNEGVAEKDRMLFRIGLNLGDVIVEGENLYEDGVNVAARLEALAEPGGISLSGKFHDEVCRKLNMSFVSTGEQEMKNIRSPVHTYKIEISEIEDLEAKTSDVSAIQETVTEVIEDKPTDEKLSLLQYYLFQILVVILSRNTSRMESLKTSSPISRSGEPSRSFLETPVLPTGESPKT